MQELITTVQRELLQNLINLYGKSEGSPVKCESLAELMNRNSGTIRNQMIFLRTLGLVTGVTGPCGGYKPTLEAYNLLNIENNLGGAYVPVYINNVLIPDISINKIEFDNILTSNCEAIITVIGDIKQLNLGDYIKIGPTPVNDLIIFGEIIGRDDIKNDLLIETESIFSFPNIQIKEISTSLICSVDYNTSLSDVCKNMIDNNFEDIPVIINNEIKGIIKCSDVIQIISQENCNVTVEELVDENIGFIKETSTLKQAMDILFQNNLSGLFLLTDDDTVSGRVSFSEILRKFII